MRDAQAVQRISPGHLSNSRSAFGPSPSASMVSQAWQFAQTLTAIERFLTACTCYFFLLINLQHCQQSYGAKAKSYSLPATILANTLHCLHGCPPTSRAERQRLLGCGLLSRTGLRTGQEFLQGHSKLSPSTVRRSARSPARSNLGQGVSKKDCFPRDSVWRMLL